jgi:primosomal protein N' (replication factor Y)
MASSPHLIEVALPLPLRQTFTYASDAPVAPGHRVVVPVRNKRVVGICVGPSDGVALAEVTPKGVIAVPDAEPAFPADLLAT